MNYIQTKDTETVLKTIASLKANGIDGFYIESRDALKKKVQELIPEGSEVMTMTSITLDTLGIAKDINESGKYNSVRKQLNSMDRATQGREMQKLGAAPDYVIGSVHAVTQDGKVIIASNTGSQLPAYVFGAGHVVWVVGTQKIVKDINEGMDRLYTHTLPLESERAHKAYGVPASFVSKTLIINKEVSPHRITLLFLNESIGF